MPRFTVVPPGLVSPSLKDLIGAWVETRRIALSRIVE